MIMMVIIFVILPKKAKIGRWQNLRAKMLKMSDDHFSFSDIENVDWPTIKSTLSSSDSWSICRLGDYFVKTGNKKRRHLGEKIPRKGKMLKNNVHHDNLSKANGHDSTEEFDMLDDVFTSQPLFRLIPQSGNSTHAKVPPIFIESGKKFQLGS